MGLRAIMEWMVEPIVRNWVDDAVRQHMNRYPRCQHPIDHVRDWSRTMDNFGHGAPCPEYAFRPRRRRAARYRDVLRPPGEKE